MDLYPGMENLVFFYRYIYKRETLVVLFTSSARSVRCVRRAVEEGTRPTIPAASVAPESASHLEQESRLRLEKLSPWPI